MKPGNTFTTALLTAQLLVAAAPGAIAGPTDFQKQQFLAYRQILQNVELADHYMYLRMQGVARKLELFYMNWGHFPQTAAEEDYFRSMAKKYLSGNPYDPKTTEINLNARMPSDGNVNFKLLHNKHLTLERARIWRQQPPPRWQDVPGSMHVILGQNCFLVWSASADQLPQRHLMDGTGKPRIIVRDLSALAKAIAAAHKNTATTSSATPAAPAIPNTANQAPSAPPVNQVPEPGMGLDTPKVSPLKYTP
jgi:hypothetical protein